MDQHNSSNKMNDVNAKKDIKKNKNCLCCLKEVQGSSRCSKCRTALYCNIICQEKHWPVHKNNCTDSNNDASDEKLFAKAKNHYDQGNRIHIPT